MLEDRGEEAEPEKYVGKATDVVADEVYRSLMESAPRHLEHLKSSEDGFVDRNVARWGAGFDQLRVLRGVCIEAGQEFQQQFLQHEEYVTDPLLGVLLRLHAHACRVTGAITTLLINGYPDDALARWRTLHELVVTAIVLQKFGRDAAQQYALYGTVQSVAGMNGYQQTAERMGRRPYAEDELKAANQLRERILAQCGDDFRSRNGWARRFLGSSKFENLQKAADLEHWRNDYAFASRDIHTDYREMGALMAMSEASSDLLLAGQSNSGMVEPAHMTAIALAQITSTFIFTYVEDDSPLDYTSSVVYGKVITRLTDEVGNVFLRLHEKPNGHSAEGPGEESSSSSESEEE